MIDADQDSPWQPLLGVADKKRRKKWNGLDVHLVSQEMFFIIQICFCLLNDDQKQWSGLLCSWHYEHYELDRTDFNM